MEHTEQENAGSTGSVLGSAAEMLQSEAADLGREAKRISSEVLEQRVDQVFGLLGHVEKAVRAAARELENEHHPHIAQYINKAADEVADVRDRFHSTDLNDFLRSAENMARTRPVAAVGLAFAAGFAFVRFLKSSAPSALEGSSDYARQESSRSSSRGGSWTPQQPGVSGGYGATHATRSQGNQGQVPRQQPTTPDEQAGFYAGDYDAARSEQDRHGTGSYSTGAIREQQGATDRRQGTQEQSRQQQGGGSGSYGQGSEGRDAERRGSSGAPEHTGSEQSGARGSQKPGENMPPRSRRDPAEG